MNYNDLKLKTGDILLFSNNNKNPWNIFKWFTDFIKWGTHSNYTHIGLIVKDPNFIEDGISRKGLYLWESSWEDIPDINDNKIKMGVQIVPLAQSLKNNSDSDTFTIRRINNNKLLTNDKLTKINSIVYNKPYDINPSDWIQAFIGQDNHPQKTNRFWCSALVGYIYIHSGILHSNTDCSILKPCDFSLIGENLSFSNDFHLEPIEEKLIV